MSNPYKEIVEKLVKSWQYFVDKPAPGIEQCLCFFCHGEFGSSHQSTCIFEQAKTLLDQNPDIEEDNPWILCSERLPIEDGKYDVTVLEYNALDVYVDKFEDGRWVNQLQHQVIAWKKRPEPYRPPNYEDIGKIYPLENKNSFKVIGRIVGVDYEATVAPVTQTEKPPEPTPDPLLGWTPVWKELPEVQRCVRLIVKGFGKPLTGYINFEDKWVFTSCCTPNIELEVLAWKYNEQFPDPKLFEKPTSPPPKHLPPDFTWKRLCEELPTKPGRYYFFDEDRNVIIEQIITKDRFPFKDAEEIQRLIGFGTHWVLLSVFV